MERSALFLVTVFLFTLFGQSARSDLDLLPPPALEGLSEAEGRLISDAWYRMAIDEMPSGCEHRVIQEASYQGRPCLVARVVQHSDAMVDDQPSSMDTAFTGVVDPSLAAVAHAMVFRRGHEERRVKGSRDGSTYLLRVTLGESESELRIPLDPRATYAPFLDMWLREQKASDAGPFMTYDDEFGRQVDTVFRSLSPRRGKLLPGTSPQLDDLSMMFLIKGRNKVARMFCPDLGLEQVRCSMRQATREVGQVYAIESAFPIEGPPLPQEPLREVTWAVRWGDPRNNPPLVETDYQTMSPREGEGEGGTSSRILLRVERVSPDDDQKTTSLTETGFLNPTPYIQSEDPEVVRMAREVGGDLSQIEAVRALLDWTNETIGPSAPEGSMLSARDALRSRRGDCTECACLFAALCRALGIPSRVCAGVVILGSECCMHAWNEVFLSGRWIPVDSALGQFPAEPNRILMAIEEPEDPFLSLLNLRSYRATRGLIVRVSASSALTEAPATAQGKSEDPLSSVVGGKD